MTTYSLRDLGISPGQSKAEQLDLELPPYRQGGVEIVPEHGGRPSRPESVEYDPVTSPVPARLDITAMTEGTSFRLRFSAGFEGPCSRCLEPASWHVDIDAHAVHDEQADDEELRSDHVDDQSHLLDVTGWAQEEIGVEFPTRVLCREDCRGLCGECGINLNDHPDHEHEKPVDSRWEALKDLQLEEPVGE